MKSPGAGDVVVAVPDVVADDADPEHAVLGGQGWNEEAIVKASEGAGVIPWLAAIRVYPMPGWLICRFPKSATPLELLTVVVPASVPPPGLAPIETVTGVPLAEKSAGLSGSLFASDSCTASGEPVELNPVRMSEFTAVPAGCPVKARLHFPATDTLSGEELHWASSVSPKLSVPDTAQTSALAATHGASAVMSTVKALPALPGRFNVTEEAGSTEAEVPLGPEAPVTTKSAGAVKVRLLSASFGSLFVTWNAYCSPVPARAVAGAVAGVMT
jgi:hypothetical protein